MIVDLGWRRRTASEVAPSPTTSPTRGMGASAVKPVKSALVKPKSSTSASGLGDQPSGKSKDYSSDTAAMASASAVSGQGSVKRKKSLTKKRGQGPASTTTTSSAAAAAGAGSSAPSAGTTGSKTITIPPVPATMPPVPTAPPPPSSSLGAGGLLNPVPTAPSSNSAAPSSATSTPTKKPGLKPPSSVFRKVSHEEQNVFWHSAMTSGPPSNFTPGTHYLSFHKQRRQHMPHPFGRSYKRAEESTRPVARQGRDVPISDQEALDRPGINACHAVNGRSSSSALWDEHHDLCIPRIVGRESSPIHTREPSYSCSCLGFPKRRHCRGQRRRSRWITCSSTAKGAGKYKANKFHSNTVATQSTGAQCIGDGDCILEVFDQGTGKTF